MTLEEHNELQKLLDYATIEGLGNFINEIHPYTKYSLYRELFDPVNGLKYRLSKNNTNLLINPNADDKFLEILRDANTILKQFIKIDIKADNISPALVYILTSTDSILSNHLRPNLYKLLGSPVRYKSKHSEWLPFSGRPLSIEAIMSDLEENGCVFQLVYVTEISSEKEKQDWIIDLDFKIEQTVAIIDLLAINENNEVIAAAFNNRRIKRVSLPIDKYLDKNIQEYMEQTRDRIYTRLNHLRVQEDRNFDLYDRDVGVLDTLVITLMRILPRRMKNKRLDSNYSLPCMTPSI